MKDWPALARASGLDIPAPDLDRIVNPLKALDQAFRPLVKDLPADLEPATVYLHGEEIE